MNNYIWNKIDVDLLPDEIAPWKLARDKHATVNNAQKHLFWAEIGQKLLPNYFPNITKREKFCEILPFRCVC